MFTAFKLARSARRLRSSDEELWEEALGTLSRMEDPRALEMMLGLLRSPAAKLRHTASQHLSQLPGEHVTHALIELLVDQDAGTRSSAANALGLREITGALPTIRERLTNGEPQLQVAIIDLLWTWTKAEAIDLLIEALDHGNDEVRTRAFDTLIRSSTYRPNERVKAALLQLGPGRLTKELGTMLKGSGQTYSAAILWLIGWDEAQGTDLLLGTLSQVGKGMRLEVVRSLADRNDPRVKDALVEVVLSLEPEVARAAAWNALERIDHWLLWTHVKSAFNGTERSVAALKWMVSHLGGLATPTALAHLRAALNHPDPSIRLAVVDQYNTLGDDRSIDPLIKALDDGDQQIGLAAARVLCSIKDEKAVRYALRWGLINNRDVKTLMVKYPDLELAVLRSLLTDDDGLVRMRALSRISTCSTRETAFEALRSMPDEAILSAIAHHGIMLDIWPAPWFIERLGSMKDPRSIDPLIQALNHPRQEFRFAAAKALSSRSDPRTKEPGISKRITELMKESEDRERRRKLNRRFERSSAPWSRGSSDKSVMN